MRLTAISDIHIDDCRDPWFSELLRLMRACRGSDQVFVLAGDVFELFVGNRPVFIQRYEGFFEALEDLVRSGTQVHYIEGNHDFHLRQVMPRLKGIHLHTAEIELTLDGKKFYIAHGDLVDRKDYRYLLLRKVFRSPVIKLLAHTAPSVWVDGFGGAARKKSESMRTLDLERTRRAFRNFAVEKVVQGYDYVILGHCHDADEMVFRVGDRAGQYVNVGHPKTHRSCLVWESGQERIRRETISPFSGRAAEAPERSLGSSE